MMRGTQAITMGCARCHDHKYDPIPTADYYSLYSVFFSSDEPKDDLPRRLVDRDKPRDVRVFKRGSPGNRGDLAPRGYLRMLNDGQPQRFSDGSGRLELAEAIASADNPLTARVFVNRVWGRLFGRHLVDTPQRLWRSHFRAFSVGGVGLFVAAVDAAAMVGEITGARNRVVSHLPPVERSSSGCSEN